ncbi:uncharacterized protein TM35_000151690 [Trypanosoma theileri]|uniref:Mucin-associated surface protein (MASP) n=1 Tax=Trypanosoma theileri TaxID=67003 RepID=A0A1X0NW22_9TRYP|nr:uncharacterized protein TM35_000151690 [Trypanosoma theileri]ORC88738.1 hypothetical protein TM35_000151690 [Trypanosoma theileri]
MGKMMRHVVCLLVLMLCCAYGCVSAPAATQPSTKDHAGRQKPFQDLVVPGTGVSVPGAKLSEPRGSHTVGDNALKNCPGKVDKNGACVPGADATTMGPGSDVASGVPTATSMYPGVIDSHGGALKDKRDAVLVLKTDEKVQLPESGVSPSGVTDTSKASLLSRPVTVGNRNHTPVGPDAAAVPGYPNGVPPTINDVPVSQGEQAGVPGATYPRAKHDDRVTVHPATPVSNTADGQPKFPGVDPKVAPADPVTDYPGVNQTLLHVGGAPTVAINRGSGPIPPPPPEVSPSGREASTTTQREQNGTPAAESESTSTQEEGDAENTESTTTNSTTSPETSDSSIISSVWVRVPLLIVVTLACILVC